MNAWSRAGYVFCKLQLEAISAILTPCFICVKVCIAHCSQGKLFNGDRIHNCMSVQLPVPRLLPYPGTEPFCLQLVQGRTMPCHWQYNLSTFDKCLRCLSHEHKDMVCMQGLHRYMTPITAPLLPLLPGLLHSKLPCHLQDQYTTGECCSPCLAECLYVHSHSLSSSSPLLRTPQRNKLPHHRRFFFPPPVPSAMRNIPVGAPNRSGDSRRWRCASWSSAFGP